jgi:hypothetical protein
MNDLERFVSKHSGHLLHKWKHYFEIYDRHFSRYRGTEVHLIEVGVNHGGSLQMWADYFGPRARIYGIDINPACRKLAGGQIEILIGDQEDRAFLRSVVKKVPRIDILIDDGGHMMRQQVTTFEELFAHVDSNGVYLCEDLHTSYWPQFGGGYRKSASFIEYSKNFIDYLNAWHSPEKKRLDVSDFTRSAHSLHYYDSVLVIEKRPIAPPRDVQKGSPHVPEFVAPPKPKPRFKLFG